jgi:hypothetical protein
MGLDMVFFVMAQTPSVMRLREARRGGRGQAWASGVEGMVSELLFLYR